MLFFRHNHQFTTSIEKLDGDFVVLLKRTNQQDYKTEFSQSGESVCVIEEFDGFTIVVQT